MAYWEWGDPANPRVLVCVHGLSRQGRDFDTLAADLSHYRVVCPDVVGRGQSDWLADPMGYAIPPTWPTWSRCWRGWTPSRSTGSAPRWAG
jgi:pimeloyl-ACP methyl ester carboxylesterase